MAKVLVLYHSSYGHTAKLADAIGEGALGTGAQVDILRVPETVPPQIVETAGFQYNDKHREIGDPQQLAEYDAIVVGTPTRYGRMASQMTAFWDRTGALWQSGALVGKVGAAFVSTASQHGGQETTQFSVITNLLHMGMTVVGLDYGFQGQMTLDEITGNSPYGASTIAGGDGARQPSALELEGGRYLGRRVADTAAKLA